MTQILHSEVQFLLSTATGSQGFTNPGTPGKSTGRWLSTTVISTTKVLDNLFTDITAAQNSASQVDYQCLFVFNNTISGNSMQNTVVWLPQGQQIGGGATMQMATDNIGVVSALSSSPQAAQIASNTTAPSGVSAFVNPSVSNAGGLKIPGSVPPGSCFALWLKRLAHNTAPQLDGFSVEVDFQSGR